MKGGGKPTLDAKKVAERLPEFRSEKKALIGDNSVWKAVVMHYHIYYNLCKPKCIDGDLNRFIVDHLCKSINDN